MLKYLYILLFSLLLLGCRQRDSKAIVKEISNREVNESYQAVSLQDTTAASLKKVTIKDHIYRPVIERELVDFYKKYDYRTRWLYQNKPSALFTSYIKVLDEFVDYGFFPENYHKERLAHQVDSLYKYSYSSEQLEGLDREITASFLLFTNHLTRGRIPKVGDEKRIWRRNRPYLDNVELLLKLKDDDNLSLIIDALQPQQSFYKAMAQKYRELEKDTAITYPLFSITDLKSYGIGYADSTILALRAHLEYKGYKSPVQGEPQQVDSLLIEAVKEFQRSIGIPADGIPGALTMNYLQMNIKQKRDLLLLNMERLRWQNKDLGEDYILVNIPEYCLRLFHKDSLMFETRVVVGNPKTPTPIFSDSLRYIEFRPTWSVPQSIVRKEMIPNIISSGDSLKYAKRGYKLYENNREIDPTQVNWKDDQLHKRIFYFVEDPSERNSLGLVKFVLYNDMSIYLHDTPSKRLFGNTQRTYSHGCIRVEYPDQFATYLLKSSEDWDEQKVREAMDTGKNQYRVHPKKHFVIDISYLTAWVDKKGNLIIRNDPYQFDKEQLKVLNHYKTM
jgi:Uncharacterized protein conserved in bacteria